MRFPISSLGPISQFPRNGHL